MNGDGLHYGIRAGLPQRVGTPAVIGARFIETLDTLSEIDALLARWNVLDLPARAALPLAQARPRIAAIVEHNVVRDDHDQAEPTSGYKAIGVVDNGQTSRKITFRVAAGAVYQSGDMMLQVGELTATTDPQIVSYPLFRKALLAIIATWQAPWGCANVFRMDYWEEVLFPGAPLFPYSRFHIPWVAYLSPKLATGFALPADIRIERVHDGGLLMTATEQPLDPTNPEHLRRARGLAEALIARTGEPSP
jgi:Immunity protein 52